MVKFKKIAWSNFLSTGNAGTEVLLDRSPTTLIVGENGAGKSTILDAICFALFNKAFRSISKPQLINSINGKQARVEVEFEIGRRNYRVVRGIKPAIFLIYVDGNLINQEADSRDFQRYLEEHILKLNYKSFTQIVILGSASFTPFMQLPPSHRREIIEDLLDIRIFSSMNTLLKERTATLKEGIRVLESDIETQKERVRIQDEYIKTLQVDQQQRRQDLEQRIETAGTEIDVNAADIMGIEGKINTLSITIADQDQVLAKHKKLLELQKKLSERISKSQTEIAFYHDNDNCPTCQQGLPHDLKASAIDAQTNKMTEIQTALVELNAQLDAINQRIQEITAVESDIHRLNAEIIAHNNNIIANQKYIVKLQAELNAHTDSDKNIDEERQRLKALAREVVTMNGERATLNEQRYYQEIVGSLLKDTGIKTKIVRQYLPVINKLVNKYLSAMDFFVHFELDEAFNETIKSRHRDDFSYASFSEGEKQRIDLALLFTWRTIAKMKNSAATNLLLLDEVFDSSLDGNGTEYLMSVLNTLDAGANVFVISHKGDQLFDKFRSLIRFEKHQNFSRIAPK
jgi:DNA repair exonuclease SbcCD ATPase subunit